LLLGVEALAADAVLAPVLAEIDLAGVPQGLQDLLHHRLVARLGGPDEVVIGDAEPPPRFPEGGRDLVGVGLRRHPGLGSGGGDVVPVLVGAGEEPHAVATQPVIARHGVGDDGGVSVAQMGARVHVVDGRGEVERAHGCFSWASTCGRPSQVSWASGTSASVPSGKPTTTDCLSTRSDLTFPVMHPLPPQSAWQAVLTLGRWGRSSW